MSGELGHWDKIMQKSFDLGISCAFNVYVVQKSTQRAHHDCAFLILTYHCCPWPQGWSKSKLAPATRWLETCWCQETQSTPRWCVHLSASRQFFRPWEINFFQAGLRVVSTQTFSFGLFSSRFGFLSCKCGLWPWQLGKRFLFRRRPGGQTSARCR